MTNPNPTLPLDSAPAAELAKFHQQQSLPDRTELVAHIGHFIYDESNERDVHISDGCARIYGTSAEEYLYKMLSTKDDLADIVAEDRERVAEELIRSADKAMYREKRAGKNDFGFVSSAKF